MVAKTYSSYEGLDMKGLSLNLKYRCRCMKGLQGCGAPGMEGSCGCFGKMLGQEGMRYKVLGLGFEV